MENLAPAYAANLASDVYDVKSTLLRETFKKIYKNDFLMSEGESLKGKTGAFLFLKSEHTMGVAACGINEYEGHAIVALKGTASGFDALTDLNAGIKRFVTGGEVHQGFYYTFQSFLPDLDSFIKSLPPSIHTIHCVGHSLGGALATLVADYLRKVSSRRTKLYTFGSPRVGLQFFAEGSARRLGRDNIFRVYHKTDPVPMVPTWPFMHVPDGGPGDILLNSGLALNPAAYHKMGNYIKSISAGETKGNWDALRRLRPRPNLTRSVEQWLEADGVISLTLSTAQLAGDAVMWVVKKVAELAGISLVMTGSTAFTILDRLAILMQRAYEFGKTVSHWVMRLIKRLAQLIGIVITETTNITLNLIRTIFIRMHKAVSELVLRAGRYNEQ
ncbi:lipase family protein [Simiduia litorea]|uniref:lipase family protein n=1 Tax=Simiduia litorea TaxID=1435348 RepID=UPI0036F2F41E